MATRKTDKETPAEQKAHVHAILEKITNVMFLSFATTGESPTLSARPLHVTKLEEDDTMWFMVDLDSSKVAEVKHHPRALITVQDESRWMHLVGRATVVTDRARIRELWHKYHEAWFPKGPDDPNVGLIRFEPESAEYWDNSGIIGVKYLFQTAKALLTGSAAQPVKGVHGEVRSKD